MTLPKDEVSDEGCTRVRNMRAFAVVAAFIEIATIVVATEGRIDSFRSRERLCGVIPCSRPEVLN